MPSDYGRWLISAGIAVVAALFLFLLIFRLIEAGSDPGVPVRANVSAPLRAPDIVRGSVQADMVTRPPPLHPQLTRGRQKQTLRREPALPTGLFEPLDPTGIPPLPSLGEAVSSLLSDLDSAADSRSAGGVIETREPQAIERDDPVYPPLAERNGVEGWVRISFAITADGGVADIRIIDADPQGIFDGAVLKAVSGWRYRPQTVDGEPVQREGIEVTFQFRIE